MQACVKFICKHAQGADLVGVGLSLGGNQMLKLAGEDENCPLQALVSVNNPFDIISNNNLMRGTLYETYLVKATVKNVIIPHFRNTSEAERAVFKAIESKYGLDFERLKGITTWRELDELFTLKVNPRFKSSTVYYNAASSLNSLQRIRVPTLVLHALDDGITPI